MSGFQRSVMMAMGGGITITTSSDAENVNLRTLLDAAGFDNDTPTIINYKLNSGVTVTSAASTGTATPAWQTGTIGSIHTVLIYISGAIKGYGGAGGQRGSASTQQSQANGKNGGTGGTSFTAGITMYDQWRLDDDLAGDHTPIASNLERVDTATQSFIGSAMTQSSGIFTFPSTGIYLVGFSLYVYASNSDGFVDGEIHVTTNNSSYAEVANSTAGIETAGDTVGNSSLAQTLIDVTDTSNVKVKFYVDTLNTTTQVVGSTSATKTGFTFIRLGDT